MKRSRVTQLAHLLVVILVPGAGCLYFAAWLGKLLGIGGSAPLAQVCPSGSPNTEAHA